MMFGPQTQAAVRDDMSFELDGLFGPQAGDAHGAAARMDCQVGQIPG